MKQHLYGPASVPYTSQILGLPYPLESFSLSILSVSIYDWYKFWMLFTYCTCWWWLFSVPDWHYHRFSYVMKDLFHTTTLRDLPTPPCIMSCRIICNCLHIWYVHINHASVKLNIDVNTTSVKHKWTHMKPNHININYWSPGQFGCFQK